MLVWPAFGLVGIWLATAHRSGIAIAVSCVVEILMMLVFLEYWSYSLTLSDGALRQRSCLRHKRIELADVDLIQFIRGGRGSRLIYLRHLGRIVFKESTDLDGFDDLVERLKVYAHRHGIKFAVRDEMGHWT